MNVLPLESFRILPPKVMLYEGLTDDHIAGHDLLLLGTVRETCLSERRGSDHRDHVAA